LQTNTYIKGPFVKKISFLLPLLFTLTLLQGCNGGGGGGSGSSSVRLVNGTSNSLDLVSPGIVLASAVTYGNASSYVSLVSGVKNIGVANTGTGIPLQQNNYYLSPSVNYTFIAYTSGQSMLITPLADNEIAPVTGYGKFRIDNLSTDTGNVDVYMSVANGLIDTYVPSAPSAALLAAPALVTSLSGSTGFYEIPQATYHIWITGAGDKTDLRLDIPSIVISDQQIETLVLTGTTGGVLVDGLLITQQGAVVAQKNVNARIRITANTSDGPVTAANVDGNSLLGSSTSLTSMLGPYVLVPSGPLTINVNTIPCTGISATAGEDITLLVTGLIAAPSCNPIPDDNTRPASGKAKLRLVNGVNSGAPRSLVYDSITIAPNVGFGIASTPYIVNSGIATNIAVYIGPTFQTTLQSQGVYSIFMLGNTASPIGILNLDH
jgi:Domain of unknown function (DUF4397)